MDFAPELLGPQVDDKNQFSGQTTCSQNIQSDLRPYVVETQRSRCTELSMDYYLVVNFIRLLVKTKAGAKTELQP